MGINKVAYNLEKLIHASVDGTVVIDTAGNIILASDTFCKIFSSTTRDVIGTSIYKWLMKQDSNVFDSWKGLEKHIKENGIAKDIEFGVKNDEGEILQKRLMKSSIRWN